MFVNQQTRRCDSCHVSEDTLSEIVDIPLEEVSLVWKAVACPCGYFSQVRHHAVSFNKWHGEKWSIGFDLKWAVNVEERVEIESRLLKLGSVPIPDHLYVV